MGSANSKQAKENDTADKHEKFATLQDKHVSADSTMPLAANASRLTFPATPPANRHLSWDDQASVVSRCRTNTSRTITGSPDQYPETSITLTGSSPQSAQNVTPNEGIYVHETEGHSNVSRPPPPPRLRHLSELIDPEELPADVVVRSPSGNMLARAQYLMHPNRPLSIRERQEEIREKVRTASRLGVEAAAVPKPAEQKKEKKSRCCNCFKSVE